MAEAVNTARWLNEAGGGRRFAIALLAGLVVELIAFGALLPALTLQKPPPSDHQSIVKLSVIAPAPPAPPTPPPPKPVPPPPKPVVPPPVPVPPPPPMPVAPPVPLPPPLAPPHHMVARRPPPPRRHVVPPRVTPPVQQPPPVEQPPPPAAAPAAPSAGELDLFQAEMRRAVQAAAVNPASAELAHEAGVVRVRFVYEDGVASGITVIGSSGYPLLDQAAMQAVRNAQFPPQPPDFAGRADEVQVDVIFRAAAEDVDGD